MVTIHIEIKKKRDKDCDLIILSVEIGPDETHELGFDYFNPLYHVNIELLENTDFTMLANIVEGDLHNPRDIIEIVNRNKFLHLVGKRI